MCSLWLFLYFTGLFGMASASSLPNCTECPPNGLWSDWVDATTCSSECGLHGLKVVKRTCLSAPYGCPCDEADEIKAVNCPNNLCTFPIETCAGTSKKFNLTSKKWYCEGWVAEPAILPTCELSTRFTYCPPGGIWSNWKSVGLCTASCGGFGTVNQERTCLTEYYGLACTGSSTRSTSCPRIPCAPPRQCKDASAVVVTNLQSGKRQCGVSDLPESPVYMTCPTCTNYPTRPVYADCAAVGNGFTEIRGSCYKLIGEQANFTDARLKCKDHHPDADLGTIRNEEEHEGILGLITPEFNESCRAWWLANGFPQYGSFWIGLNEPHSPTNGEWLSGADATYRRWAPLQPDNDENRGNESATEIYLFESQWGVLGDFNDYYPFRVICGFLCEVITKRSGPPCA